MNRKVSLTILLIALACSVSFAAASTSNAFSDLGIVQHRDNLERFAVTVPIVIEAGLHSHSVMPLNQPTRLEIDEFIKSHPGVHFRGICDSLDLSVGVVQYHLNVLEHSGLVQSYSDGQNKRYFETNTFTQSDMKLISLTRHETTAKILIILSQNPSVLHRDIACGLGVSSQALTWQMNQLKKMGLIDAEKTGVNVKYSLNDADAIKFILNLTSNTKINKN